VEETQRRKENRLRVERGVLKINVLVKGGGSKRSSILGSLKKKGDDLRDQRWGIVSVRGEYMRF